MCDRALPPQAFLLRDEGGAGQLGDGHHQDEGKTGISALMREVAGAALTSRTCGDRGSVGGSSPRSPSISPNTVEGGAPAFPPRHASRGAVGPREQHKVFQVTRHQHKSYLVEKLRDRGQSDHNNPIVALSPQIRRLSAVAVGR